MKAKTIAAILICALAATALADTAGPRGPATMSAAHDGSVAWQTPNNAKFDDGAFTYCAQSAPIISTSETLVASNFGFNVPAGSAIVGVEVRVKREAVLAAKDATLFFLSSFGDVSEDKADPNDWPTNFDTKVYGSSSDRWSLFNLSAEYFNSSAFAVNIKANVGPGNLGSQTSAEARIDFISATIYYQPGQPPPPAPAKRKRAPIVSQTRSAKVRIV